MTIHSSLSYFSADRCQRRCFLPFAIRWGLTPTPTFCPSPVRGFVIGMSVCVCVCMRMRVRDTLTLGRLSNLFALLYSSNSCFCRALPAHNGAWRAAVLQPYSLLRTRYPLGYISRSPICLLRHQSQTPRRASPRRPTNRRLNRRPRLQEAHDSEARAMLGRVSRRSLRGTQS